MPRRQIQGSVARRQAPEGMPAGIPRRIGLRLHNTAAQPPRPLRAPAPYRSDTGPRPPSPPAAPPAAGGGGGAVQMFPGLHESALVT